MSDRRRVRVLHAHTAVVTDLDSAWGDYHEWVPRGRRSEDFVRRDSLGRENGYGWTLWQFWCCNNTECGGLALVNVNAVEEMVQGWLSDDYPAALEREATR